MNQNNKSRLVVDADRLKFLKANGWSSHEEHPSLLYFYVWAWKDYKTKHNLRERVI